jgi:hypothetical protein
MLSYDATTTFKEYAMRRTLLAICAIAGSAAVLFACSNVQPPTGSTSASDLRVLGGPTQAFGGAQHRNGLIIVDPAKIKAQVYVGAFTYPSSSTPILDYKAKDTKNKPYFCKITVGEAVNSIAVDSTGELWVPEGYDSSISEAAVVSFGPDCGKAGTTLSDPDGEAGGIAWSSKGTAYVDDIGGPSSTAGNVAIYPKGKTAPTGELTNPAIYLAGGVAVDSKDNVYVSFFTNPSKPSGATGVLKFAGGKMPGRLLKKIKLAIPGVPLIDSHDDMLITNDANSAPVEDIYAPPYTKKPATFSLKGNSPQCSLDAKETTLACGDKQNDTVDFYSYPGGKYLYSISKGITPTVIGVAQDPN